MIVAFPPGGPSDIVARLMADKLTEALGRPAVVENVSGASGNIGTERVAKSVPDGHTLLISAPGPLVVNPSLYQKVPFDPIRDFAPISQLCFTPNVLVGEQRRAGEVACRSSLQLARKNPGAALLRIGRRRHQQSSRRRAVQAHGRDQSPARALSGRLGVGAGYHRSAAIPVAFLSLPTALPLARDGKLRALAVGTATRWPAGAGNPDHGRARGPRLHARRCGIRSWRRPERRPRSSTRLHRETMRIPRAAGCAQDLRRPAACAVIGSTPAEFAAVIKDEGQQWAKVIKESGLKVGN